MLPLKIKVNRVCFNNSHQQVECSFFLNKILYCSLTAGQYKYFCINLKSDQIDLEVDVGDNVYSLEINNATFVGFTEKRENLLLPFGKNEEGVIDLQILRIDCVAQLTKRKESINESKSEYSLNTIVKQSNINKSIQKSSQIMIEQDAFSQITSNDLSQNLIKGTSNTTLETNKQNDQNNKFSYEFDSKTSLNELAQERERIIRQLFSKLKIENRD